MNEKLVREGMVGGQESVAGARDRVFNGIASTIVQTAGKKEEKQERKEEKAEGKADKKEMKFQTKMTKKEAEDIGFFKAARACGWGIYDVSALDGGEGGVWYLEKAADGIEYLVKQTDEVGNVVRRVKQAAATA